MRAQAEQWRAEHRIIDLHQHLNGTTQHLTRAVHIMDRVGVAVNLSGGTVTRGTNAASPFERVKKLADALAPGRIVHYMNLDYADWDVVEAFIASDTNNVKRYTEYEVSPTNERLDVKIPEKNFVWSSGFESATRVDE